MARDPVLVTDSTALNVTVSAGVAVLPNDALTESALVAAADKALYGAKHSGRNRAVEFSNLPPGRPAAG